MTLIRDIASTFNDWTTDVWGYIVHQADNNTDYKVNFRDLIPNRFTPTISGGNLIVNCNNIPQCIVDPTPRPMTAGTINISFSNNSSTDVIYINMNITGTVVLQFPETPFSGREEVRANADPSSISVWDSGNKTLTLSGVTVDKFPISLVWNNSENYYDMRVGEVVE